MKKEQRIKIVFEVIKESRQQISDIGNSVGPSASESLKKAERFLTVLEKENVSDVPRENWTRTFILAVTLSMLLAFGKLLQELGPEAVAVIGQILRKQ